VRNCISPLAVAIVLFALLAGCSKPVAEAVSLDTGFTLLVGESVSVGGEDLVVKFVEVVAGSRCPRGATCIWAGEASCLIELTHSGSTFSKVLTQPGLTMAPGDSVAGYDVVSDLLPYPELGKETKTSDYRLKLVISKEPG